MRKEYIGCGVKVYVEGSFSAVAFCCREKPSLQDVIALEQYFGMSHQAMLWRLVSERYLEKDDMGKYGSGVMLILMNCF